LWSGVEKLVDHHLQQRRLVEHANVGGAWQDRQLRRRQGMEVTENAAAEQAGTSRSCARAARGRVAGDEHRRDIDCTELVGIPTREGAVQLAILATSPGSFSLLPMSTPRTRGGRPRGSDHRGRGDDLAVLADMHAGRVEPQVHEQLVIQPAIPEDGDVVVDGLADP
jgi:hypothetical protein